MDRPVKGLQVGNFNTQINTFVVNRYGVGALTHRIDEIVPEAAPDLDWLREQPSRLLHARSRIVGFAGRDDELARLTAWRDTGPQVSFLLVYGPGGQGKTRLADQFVELSRAAGWRTLAASQSPDEVTDTAPVGQRPVLLVVDYADRWAHTALLRLFGDPVLAGGGPVRVLLLARSMPWWPAMRGDLSAVGGVGTTEFELRALGRDASHRAALFSAARARFCAADIYDLAAPDAISPPGPLDHPDYGLVLAVHMAALVAVDAAARGTTAPRTPHELSAYLLDREHANWQRLYGDQRQREFRTPPSVMARTVFLAALTGGLPQGDAERVVGGLIGELPADRIVTDHRVCYPARTHVLEPLYPDRLAEDFIALLLPGHDLDAYYPDPWTARVPPSLLARGDDGAPPAYVARSLTFLAAAAKRWAHVGAGHLVPALEADPRLAVDAGSAALTGIAAVAAVPVGVFERIDDLLPQDDDANLAPGRVEVYRRIVAHRLAGPDSPLEKARAVLGLARRLSFAGLHDEATDLYQQSIGTFRGLLETMVEDGFPDDIHESANTVDGLCGALTNYSGYLLRQDRPDEALEPAREAVAWRRTMVQLHAPTYEMSLAIALNNLSACQLELGQLGPAEAAVTEAVAILRRRAREDPAGRAPALLAGALNNLARFARGVPRSEVIREAVDRQEALRTTDPAAHTAAAARYHDNLAFHLGADGRFDEAVAAQRQAIAHHDALASTANADAYRDGRVEGSLRLAFWLDKAGQGQEAVAAARAAFDLYRDSAVTGGRWVSPLLSTARILLAAGLPAEVLDIEQAAVAALREEVGVPADPGQPWRLEPGEVLAMEWQPADDGSPVDEMRANVNAMRILARLDPPAFREALGAGLSRLALAFRDQGHWGEGVAAAEEALDHGEDPYLLARARLALAACLRGLGKSARSRRVLLEAERDLRALDDDPSSLAGLAEEFARTVDSTEKALWAVAWARDLWESAGDAARLANNHAERAAILYRAGDVGGALLARTDAAVAWRAVTADSTRYYAEYAGALVGVAALATELEVHEAAAGSAAEALTAWLKLVFIRGERYERDVAGTLSVLGTASSLCGNSYVALVATAKSVVWWRRVTDPDRRAGPEATRPTDRLDLAGALSNLSNRLADLRIRPGTALRCAAAAVDLVSETSAGGRLATALLIHSNRLADVGRFEDAAAQAERAVTLLAGTDGEQLALAVLDRHLDRIGTARPPAESPRDAYRRRSRAWPVRQRVGVVRPVPR